jgi:hypothetical protein
MAGVGRTDAERALRAIAAEKKGKFTRDAKGVSFPGGIVITPGEAERLTILYPGWLVNFEPLTKQLSKALRVPTFLFHIHDGDFWMYCLFDGGKEVDRFNPIPDYWMSDVSARERKTWAGNARKVAAHWPGLNAAAVERYLVFWDLKAKAPGKAYPDDRSPYGDCRQLSDFMRRLGLGFPIDDDENPVGTTYRFDLPSES